MEAFLLSFGIIFVAELGDKSQLMAMTFAAKYRAITILTAITLATALVHLVSVLFGARSRGDIADRPDIGDRRRRLLGVRGVDATR